jgi:hypothetical protein
LPQPLLARAKPAVEPLRHPEPTPIHFRFWIFDFGLGDLDIGLASAIAIESGRFSRLSRHQRYRCAAAFAVTAEEAGPRPLFLCSLRSLWFFVLSFSFGSPTLESRGRNGAAPALA